MEIHTVKTYACQVSFNPFGSTWRILLLKNLDHLSCGVFQILDWTDFISVVLFDIFSEPGLSSIYRPDKIPVQFCFYWWILKRQPQRWQV